MHKRNTDRLARAKTRPDPAQWGEDEVMTLVEAAAVFFPEGPLTLSSLRRAAAAGTLEIAKVAGKDLTTPRAIRKLVKPSCRASKPSRHDSGSEKTKDAGSSSIGQAESDGRSAQAAAATTLTALRKRSKSTSADAHTTTIGATDLDVLAIADVLTFYEGLKRPKTEDPRALGAARPAAYPAARPQ